MERQLEYTKLTEGPYKYRLEETYTHGIELPLISTKQVGGFVLYDASQLKLKEGYATDGPSGPTLDTENFIRASFVHDALYQLIREGVLPQKFRKKADRELRRICREDGMGWFRACYIYRGVRCFGAKYARSRSE